MISLTAVTIFIHQNWILNKKKVNTDSAHKQEQRTNYNLESQLFWFTQAHNWHLSLRRAVVLNEFAVLQRTIRLNSFIWWWRFGRWPVGKWYEAMMHFFFFIEFRSWPKLDKFIPSNCAIKIGLLWVREPFFQLESHYFNKISYLWWP